MNNCAFYLEINSIRYTSDVISLNLLKLKILTFITCLVPRFSHLTYIRKMCALRFPPSVYRMYSLFNFVIIVFSTFTYENNIFMCTLNTPCLFRLDIQKYIETRSLHIVVKHKHKIVFTPYRFLNAHCTIYMTVQ